MILSRSDAKAILDRALSFAKADETEVSLSGDISGNTRFACNIPTTCGLADSLHFSVTSVFGKRVGSFSTSQVDDASLESAIRQAESAAKLSPENPEYMPRLGAQNYTDTNEWDDATKAFAHEERAKIAAASIDAAEAKKLVAAGYYENNAGFTALANSKGLFAYHTSTDATYSLTVRTPDGSGSGWSAQDSFTVKSVDGRRITDRAIEKALRSQTPQTIEPGKYPVILEHSPAGDMLNLFIGNLDRRSADEGRSYFSDPKKGTKIGDKLFGDNITIYSDPSDAVVPSSPWGEDGLPLSKTMWVESGVQKNLACSRYWAGEKKINVLPSGSNVIMNGDSHSLDDLIASMDHGLLVTSFWYIREVDPQSILFT
ncbi:MAG TPA: metallopeptidase TldD-related protein, partial [Candidatus Kapabacteria bacterium]|nr:metallopeptidase TldD-related protein [Candidatus Kapabacteria bacterium]